MGERLAIAVERYDTGDTTSELNVIDSWVHGVPELFDSMPTDGEEGAVNITRRMADGRHRRPRCFLGTAVDPLEAYAWSWQEIARLRAEQARVASLIHPGATREEAVAFLDGDPAQRIEGRESFRAWMQELAERTIAELHGKHFDIPEPARRIEALIAPVNNGGIYYTGPSQDWSRRRP